MTILHQKEFNKDVSKEEFDIELQKQIDVYAPLNEHWVKKEQLRDNLARDRILFFREHTKHILGYAKTDYFIAAEEEIFDIAAIIEENESDPLDDDSFRIAVALYNAGYRKEIK